jgi:hypothetical protein
MYTNHLSPDGLAFGLPSFFGIQIKYRVPVLQAALLRNEDPSDRSMQLITVKVEKPGDTNFILGQTHFIKSVEDIHEALVGAVPGIKFGLAFCEASGKCLVR